MNRDIRNKKIGEVFHNSFTMRQSGVKCVYMRRILYNKCTAKLYI